MSGVGQARAVRLFDAHCHLQDSRIAALAPRLIRTALDSGVLRFAVNGVSEKDWHIVKHMSDEYPCIIPCFGLHPWYVAERSPDWMRSLKDFFAATPTAAVGEALYTMKHTPDGIFGRLNKIENNYVNLHLKCHITGDHIFFNNVLEIGIDKGSHGKNIEFAEQVEVFRQQLELAKELRKPVSVHCVRAFGDLLEILQQTGPFPAGLVLHSYLGSAEMVSGLAKLGSYFSFSGYLTSMNMRKAKKMLKSVPLDRILIESDAPDGLSKWNTDSLFLVPEDDSTSREQQNHYENSSSETTTLSKEALNHPANISNVLNYVAMLLDMPEEELAELSYQNATRVFSYPGSKV